MVNLVHQIFKLAINLTHILALVGIILGAIYYISLGGAIVIIPLIIGAVIVYALLIGFINWTLVVSNKLDTVIEKLDAIAKK